MTQPHSPQEQLIQFVSTLFSYRIVAFVLSIGIAAGAVASIATGFYLTYRVATLIGN